MRNHTDTLDRLWDLISRQCVMAGEKEAITDNDLEQVIMDEHGSSYTTLWHYKRLLKNKGWIVPANSGKLYFLRRRKDSSDEIKIARQSE